MDKQFFKSKYFYIILVSFVAVVVLVLSGGGFSKTPKLIASNPPSGYTKLSVVEPIILEFSSNVVKDTVAIKSNPEAGWTIDALSDYAIQIKSQKALKQNSPYTISVFVKGKSVATINYKTEETQTDYDLIEDIKQEVARDYPLASLIPYETTDFKVVYSKVLTLEITMKTSTLTESQAVENVKSWVTKNGGDASAHKYTVVPFTQ